MQPSTQTSSEIVKPYAAAKGSESLQRIVQNFSRSYRPLEESEVMKREKFL